MSEKFNKWSFWYYMILVTVLCYISYKAFSNQRQLNIELKDKATYHYVDSTNLIMKTMNLDKADTIMMKLDEITKLLSNGKKRK